MYEMRSGKASSRQRSPIWALTASAFLGATLTAEIRDANPAVPLGDAHPGNLLLFRTRVAAHTAPQWQEV